MNNKDLVLSFQFRGQALLRVLMNSSSKRLILIVQVRLLLIESSLVHNDVESRSLILQEIPRGRGKVHIDHLRKKLHISLGVHSDSVHEATFLHRAIN
jgi:hypothetical protein